MYLKEIEQQMTITSSPSMESLRSRIILTVEAQGFQTKPRLQPNGDSKQVYRLLQKKARLEKISQHKEFLIKHLAEASNYLCNGSDINPDNIKLTLREVKPDSLEERLFRWWNLIWWSMPYDRPYGRQIRFLLWDVTHNAPFGLLGLHSPPLRMGIRDTALGISKEKRDWWVNMSLSAQRVGALPPYNDLLGGKMVALSLTANEVRNTYFNKYRNKSTIIQNRDLPADLLFITTTAAFGKSSLYNRLKYLDDYVVEFLGYSQGSGAFHIPQKFYEEILRFLEKENINIKRGYGHGPSRKRQLLNTAFRKLDLPSFEYHGIKRGFYLFPLVRNLHDVIQKEASPEWYNRPFIELVDYWKQRWGIPRAGRTKVWQNFDASQFVREVEKTFEDIEVAEL